MDRFGVLRRRGFLRGASAAAIGTVATGAASASTSQVEEPSVTLEDQQIDGESITVAEVATDRESELYLLNAAGDTIQEDTVHLDAGDTETDLEVALLDPLEESQQISAWLYESDGRMIASDEAFVALGDDVDPVEGLDVTLVEPDADDDFDYPYFVYAPTSTNTDEVPILVEPNNTGTSTDDFAEHREGARRTIERGRSRSTAVELGIPFVVPVFPRPDSEPVDSTHYVHQLDRETLAIDDGPLERVDRQLLAMVDHARQLLHSETDYAVREEIALNGFSASGNFADRFTVLHPERVLSVTAGGLNGMALLPQAERDGQELRYHVGIADVEELAGEAVDLEALDDTNQFLYMGENDQNDTLPYDGPWTDEELRETAREVYGEDMIEDRFPTCQAAYEDAGVGAQFRVYEDADHTPRPAAEDIVAFHRASIEGESVSEFGEDLSEWAGEPDKPTPEAAFEVTTAPPTAGDPVTFDASGSQAPGDGSLTHTWEFGDDESATGEAVEHTYREGDEYTVRLTVIADNDATDTAERTITVAAAPEDDGGENGTDPDDEGGENGSDPDDSESDGTPGFAVGTALAGLAGAAQLLRGRKNGDEGSSN